MIRLLIISLLLLFSLNIVAQTLLLNDNVVVTMKNGAKIIVNPSSNNHLGIQLTGTATGYIVGEEEINKIVWWLRDAGAGSDIIVPFANSAGISVKIKMENITAGSNDGAMIFATAPTNADNTLISTSLYPTNVTDMDDGAGSDNSTNVVDRFWFIEYNSYTTKPVAANGFTLYYSDADLGAITESTLQSQYWNTGWIRPPIGTVTTASNYVSSITDPGVSAPWVLVNKNFPLPVELIYFRAECQGNEDNLYWETASETNNLLFEIQKSYDMNTWNSIKYIQGYGNSNQSNIYSESFVHDQIAYYRIKQIDYSGGFTYFPIVSVECGNKIYQDIKVVNSPYSDNIVIYINELKGEEISVYLIDNIGRYVSTDKFKINENNFSYNISKSKVGLGIYNIVIVTSNSIIPKQIVIIRY